MFGIFPLMFYSLAWLHDSWFRGSIQRMHWHSSTVPALQSRCIINWRKQDSVLKNLSSLLPLFTSGFAPTYKTSWGFGKATAAVLLFWIWVSSSFLLLLRCAALKQAGALGGTLHSSIWQLGLCRCSRAARSARKGGEALTIYTQWNKASLHWGTKPTALMQSHEKIPNSSTHQNSALPTY